MDDFSGLDATSRRLALAVLRQGPISRAELRGRLGLSAPSLTRLAKPLVARGLLVEGEPVGPVTTGRPSVPLDVDSTRGHFLGVKFVPGRMFVVLTDLKGTVLESRVADSDFGDPANAVEAVATVVDQVRRRPDGIGISLGASVRDAGLVCEAGFMGWPDVRLAELVRRRTGLPCVVENDVTALALAEHWFGFGRGVRDFLVVTLGAGVGAGLVCEDELVRGHRGRAGMIGGLVLHDGRRLHQVVETAAIQARLADEPLAVVLADVAGAMGELIGQLCLVSAPARVLLSGEGLELLSGAERAPVTRALLAGISRYTQLEPEQLRVEPLDFAEWARGSAAMAIRAHMAAE
ncbi:MULTISPECIES: ROK family transcriptional regulator [unclassified Luteococcus]|uniref:ROK family transcriptional regulator n=1 Tax=unclassified Luteococcus TaxID=2639923 RepID=UPI00313E26A0